MWPVALAAIAICLPCVVAADIVRWQDAAGVRHYTNLPDEVPAEHRAAVQVVVNELARRAPVVEGRAEREGAPAPREPERRREARAVYDVGHPSSVYLEGFRSGLAAARPAVATGGSVQINGPLAIAESHAAAPYGSLAPWPYHYPFVTTSFDRGRSRHLTLRMLLQEQFAIDRAAPFVFVERLGAPLGRAPLGVAPKPFLPRGLPHASPRRPRVIVR